ncbi:MAG: TetR/AcrR family transcriptional regulator [Lacisediminihabitans sp.]
MASHNLGETLPGGTALLRNEPVQARSSARLSGLLDAAAEVVEEIGYERLTTAMVAERAGASIGTVYRYFPDRIVVLQSLSARYLDKFSDREHSTLAADGVTTWTEAVTVVLDNFVEFFRTEPGFKSLRFGDVLDVRPRATDLTGIGVMAKQLVTVLNERFGLPNDAALPFLVEVALEMADSLLARAFAFDPRGDERFIAEARKVVADYLGGYYGDAKSV